MDRGKSGQSSRGAKSKITQYPRDFFALGSKSSQNTDSKRSSAPLSKTAPSTSQTKLNPERKREGSNLSSVPSKKSKVSGVIRAVSSSVPSSSSSSERASSSNLEHWEQISLDIDPKEFVLQVYRLIEDNEIEKCVPYICGAIKLLKNQKFKPDKVVYLGLLYLVKHKPSVFNNSTIISALASLLKRDSTYSFKSKGNPAVPVLCANLLLHSHLQVTNWSELFVRLYVEDALGDRIWVDNEECKPFVDNIVTAFNTKVPPKSLLAPELSQTLTGSRDTSSPLPIDEETGRNTPEVTVENSHSDVPVVPRYSQSQEVVEQIVLEAIKEQLNRRQPPETITRNFLRLLSSACGLVEIRIIAVSRLEMWLHSPKLMRPAQELLAYLCCNCINITPRDLEVTAYLTKIRLKTKALINVYLNCLRELLTSHPENLSSMLKHTIYNELSNSRNPNNMPMIAVMFQAVPEISANVLAEIFQDLLLNKDDYLRSLRALLREIVRVLRFDINLLAFCRTLLAERKEITVVLRDFEFKDRMFASVADLICLSIFLGISPQVKEAAILFSRGDKKDIAVLQNYQSTVAKIQKEALTWLHDNALRLYRPSPQDFIHVLHKVLFLEPLEVYYKVDMWPSEGDRNLLYRLACEIPLLQATLIRLLLIGISKEHPVNAPDALELADQLIKRAALLPTDNFSALSADKLEIIDLIFNLTAYHYPDNITLPQGYTPPQLAISNLYWKAWIMLLILSAHNPSTIGITAWKKYPMLRTFMEMCITNHYTYPPPTTTGESYEDLKNKELQIAALDKQRILEFETHLAAASTKVTITEQNSLLLPQLIELAPMGEPRQPPQGVLDQLGALNASHKMGHLLCRSRNPDFLLEIIQRQGSFHHMPWLADLVHNSEGALSHLPVQCLCELLISGTQDRGDSKVRKHTQVLTHLQNVLTDSKKDYTASYEILEYFLRRLNSFHCSSRNQAIKGLRSILSTVNVDEDMTPSETEIKSSHVWLLKQIPNLPHFAHHKSLMVASLRQACQVETNPENIASYIHFLAKYSRNDSLSETSDLVLDMAQLIVERSTIIAAVLPTLAPYDTLHSLMVIFCSYLSKAKEPRNEVVAWSESQDHVLITWASGEECTMHILVVHAMIILLTYGPANDPALFENLLDAWFPQDGEPPKAYLVDTSEEALLIPDWLKLRMIRSTVPRLVDAALVNLEPSQLVLFIQSFGIPVSSMTKLLSNLDSAVTVDQNSVDEAVLDKCYMAQLVEVQHRRGATGGNIFVQVLQLHEPKLPEENEIFIHDAKEKFPQSTQTVSKNCNIDHNFAINFMNCLFGNISFPGNINKSFSLLLRTLGKELGVKNSNFLTSLISYININLISIEFVNNLILKEKFSTPLFRLLLTSKYFIPDLIKISQNILDKNKTQQKNSCLLDILKQFLKKQKPEKANMEKAISGTTTEILKKTDLVSLERTTKYLVERNIENSSNEDLVEAMSKILLSDVENKNFQKTGLFIDWLAELEMEIIGNSPELQINLLFSKHPNSFENWLVFRPYLLTLLTHRASWQTLQFCIDRLLTEMNSNYDPSLILNFFDSLKSNPKLWQGRDKFVPKFQKPENILRLENNQICTLVDYILEEAILGSKKGEYLLKMETRLSLVTSCIENKSYRLNLVISFLRKFDKNENFETICLDDEVENKGVPKWKISEEFLTLLYLKVPKLIHLLNRHEKMRLSSLFYVTDVSTSVSDSISHNLLTALGATSRNKDWGRKSHDFDLLLRKISAVHPILVLRQLPLIAICLKGRTHFDFQVFKSRNHLTLFYQIMGVIELLVPAIFNVSHSEGLEAILKSYFLLFENHGHLRELQTIFGRFVSFLQTFMVNDAPRAIQFLQKYAHLLNDLQIRTHVNLRPLRSLMSTISLPNENFNENRKESEVLFVPPRPITPEKIPTNYQNQLNNLPKLSDDELLQILEEIDHLSNRKPQILETVIDQIAPMILVTRSGIRQLAHNLLLRYIRYKPNFVTMESPILSSVIRSLDNDNTDIVNSSLEKLPEYVVCLQEHAALILDKAFLLAIKFNMNASPSIIKTINVLNIQSGA